MFGGLERCFRWRDASVNGSPNVRIVRGKYKVYGNVGRTVVWNWDQKQRKMSLYESFLLLRDKAECFLSCVIATVGKGIGKHIGMKADMSGD